MRTELANVESVEVSCRDGMTVRSSVITLFELILLFHYIRVMLGYIVL